MKEIYNQIPEKLHHHIKAISKSAAFENKEEAEERVAQAWLEKKAVFDDELETMGMAKINELELSDDQGALAITYSGSIVNIEPVLNGKRRVTYTSIGTRTDVPESNEEENSVILENQISIDEPIYFTRGPVKNTSQILEIAVFDEDISPVVQTQRLDAATKKLVEEFVEINAEVEEDLKVDREPTLAP